MAEDAAGHRVTEADELRAGAARYDTAVLPLSGEQVALVRGDLSAVVTEVGATLRSFRVGGEPVIWEFPEDEIASGGRGQVLAPWPNRLEDGSYRFGEVSGKAALDEPERSNAIHGLVRWMPWSLEERSGDRAVLTCVVHPQPAYPFRIRLELDYSLGDEGLEVTCAATNTGRSVAPFGLGFHPYLLGDPEGIDEAGVVLVAARRLLLDDRGLPNGDEAVAGAFDLDRRRLRGVALDDCYTDLAVGADGRWRARLELARRCSEVWADAAFAYAMCYTGDSLGNPADRRLAMAIEPMTCPPNALHTGVGVIELQPGEPWHASWGITTTPR